MVRRVEESTPDSHHLYVLRSFEGTQNGPYSFSVVHEWRVYKKSEVDEAIERQQDRED
jgi:hypothetical protein